MDVEQLGHEVGMEVGLSGMTAAMHMLRLEHKLARGYVTCEIGRRLRVLFLPLQLLPLPTFLHPHPRSLGSHRRHVLGGAVTPREARALAPDQASRGVAWRCKAVELGSPGSPHSTHLQAPAITVLADNPPTANSQPVPCPTIKSMLTQDVKSRTTAVQGQDKENQVNRQPRNVVPEQQPVGGNWGLRRIGGLLILIECHYLCDIRFTYGEHGLCTYTLMWLCTLALMGCSWDLHARGHNDLQSRQLPLLSGPTYQDQDTKGTSYSSRSMHPGNGIVNAERGCPLRCDECTVDAE